MMEPYTAAKSGAGGGGSGGGGEGGHGADPDTGLEGTAPNSARPVLPERPGEADCGYYLRTGACRYNHPRNRTAEYEPMIREKQKELEVLKESYDEVLKEKEDLKMVFEGEIKELKRMKTLAIVYEKFRQWIEDEASMSNSRVDFTNFNPSEIDGAIKGQGSLGKGGYGSVYKAVIQDTTVAIKILSERSRQGEREFKQEKMYASLVTSEFPVCYSIPTTQQHQTMLQNNPRVVVPIWTRNSGLLAN